MSTSKKAEDQPAWHRGEIKAEERVEIQKRLESLIEEAKEYKESEDGMDTVLDLLAVATFLGWLWILWSNPFDWGEPGDFFGSLLALSLIMGTLQGMKGSVEESVEGGKHYVETLESIGTHPGREVFCPSCKAEILLPSSFCPFCGHQIPSGEDGFRSEISERALRDFGAVVNAERCSHCQDLMLPVDRYCRGCGAGHSPHMEIPRPEFTSLFYNPDGQKLTASKDGSDLPQEDGGGDMNLKRMSFVICGLCGMAVTEHHLPVHRKRAHHESWIGAPGVKA